ncbi:photo-regulated tyrosinase [Russula earlei]|uniref:Photo-regulated tyrosinase n=1 Tax=Russula earlei TaxID=71964 RepID=A0ACC0UBD5_9AGAM|nr:photo-regulated tyrosinase [Russula earlei]
MSHVGPAAPNRLEINDFIKNNDQFSLFIQALNNSISHFSIGGIHGLPYVAWEGAGGSDPNPDSQWGGYCTHGSVLFPTWHRPYVALYEQVLQQNALAIAQQYQDQNRWVGAAQNLRLPYWDWATNSIPPDVVTSRTTVVITTPDGNRTTVSNPLYQYTFNPIDSSFPQPYDSWQTTIRRPDDPNSPDASTDVSGLISDLSSIQSDITSKTYRLLSRVHTWPAFSNHSRDDGGSASNSLEGIHDEIHGTVGGQMGDPSVAAFDPIFFLHHCNVDRLLSLWEAVNPGTWVTRGPAEGGTFTIPGDATVDVNSALTPFWDSQTAFWASSQTQTTKILQYSYPEFNNLNLNDPGTVQRAIANYINQQYGGGAFSAFSSGGPAVRLFAQPAGGAAPAPAAQATTTSGAASAVKAAVEQVTHPFHSRGGPTHTAHQAGYGKEGPSVVHDWGVRIHVKKYELGGSFSVLIFLGDVPDDPSHWRSCPSFVGLHYAFVNSVASQCGNCRNQADLVIEGFVHLNEAIAKRSGLSSYEPEVVSPYLKENLHWRVQGRAVHLERLPSLEVTVSQTTLTHEPGALFPIPGEPLYHHHITFGRPGGARHAQA